MGMNAFIDKNRPSFVAHFKQRFTDFIVHEVDMDGNVVKLTDVTTLPECDKLEAEAKQQTFTKEEVVKEFSDLMGQELAVRFTDWFTSDSNTREREFSFSGNVVEEKNLRTTFHELVRKHCTGLESETEEKSNVKVIVVRPARLSGGRKNLYWPRGKPQYLQFVLYKENKDTTNAIHELARAIHAPAKMFQNAGTKDKRAVTTQLVTVQKKSAPLFLSVNPNLIAMKVGNFKYVDKPLKLGSLGGNHFTITLRAVSGSHELVKDACEHVKQFGFVNYFGTQRFGTSTIPTHHIGRALLLSKWEDAIDLILEPRLFETKESFQARLYYKEKGDIDGTLARLPKKHVIERLVLKSIKSYGKTLNAFSQLPYNVRLLYVHAYQSYVWNMAASKRINLGVDMLPMIGDLVLVKNGSKNIEYEYVTEENRSNYTIHDVYLPLPGYSVKYPTNEVGKYYEEIMKEDNLSPHDMKRSQRVFSLPGGYRQLLKKPTSFEYSLVTYSDYNVALTTTDWQELNNSNKLVTVNKDLQPIESLTENTTTTSTTTTNTTTITAPKKEFLAVILKLILDSSTYATMLIRELTKNPTSNVYQREIQEKHEKEVMGGGGVDDEAEASEEDEIAANLEDN
eukprot:TRINITY_DN1084_c2_g1_i1.p1 TRINITY_DN1084_c2_g1~~TRINITY_DN1084_c2_g1_i1.p1  ORF type:complete len:710 (-),score=167.90 TRINITY_DN1084_c2_g1_i1:139-2007(-)